MNTFDITVAVTAHDETVVAGPSMRSAELSIFEAEKSGFTVERLIALDAATSGCHDFFKQEEFSRWNIAEYEFAELGSVRNAIVKNSCGRWIAFLDADDLFSVNWLASAARYLLEADSRGEKVIAHPELNWIFDDHSKVWVKTSQDDPIFSPYFFYISNYYDSMCMAPREAHIDFPYTPRVVKDGLGYQDWYWNIETMSAGWHHIVIDDTIIFKRRRQGSLSMELLHRKSLIRSIDAMAIDRVKYLPGNIVSV